MSVAWPRSPVEAIISLTAESCVCGMMFCESLGHECPSYMTHNESLLWSLARCVIIASIAVWPVAILVARIEASPTVRSRRLRLLLAVFPFFLPELLIGFNYRLTATQLTSGTSPLTAAICTEGLYGLLLLSRCMAVGVALSILLPRSNATE